MTLPDIISLMPSDPIRAAAELDAIAAKFQSLADSLRGQNRDGGGMTERVQMQVVSAAGELKQSIQVG